MKKRHAFMWGCLGGLLVLAVSAVSASQYSDYSARASSDAMLALATPFQAQVGPLLVERQRSNGTGSLATALALSGDEQKVFSQATVLSDGTLLLTGRQHGQLIALVPAVSDGVVRWRCLGGPAKDVPSKCRAGADAGTL